MPDLGGSAASVVSGRGTVTSGVFCRASVADMLVIAATTGFPCMKCPTSTLGKGA